MMLSLLLTAAMPAPSLAPNTAHASGPEVAGATAPDLPREAAPDSSPAPVAAPEAVPAAAVMHSLAPEAVATSVTRPEPYPLGTVGTPAGARMVAERLFAATEAGDDAAYDQIARGMAVMLAPDFAVAATRGEFAQVLSGCTDRQIAGVRPFRRMPPAQIVRVMMRCPVEGRQQDIIADLLTDDAHAFAFFPGGMEPAGRGAQ